MIYLTISSRGVEGNLSKSRFELLPVGIQEEFLSMVNIDRVSDGQIYFSTANSPDAQNLAVRIRDADRARERAAKRANALYTGSEGHHNSDDIAELFTAQEGRCYYSGQTLDWSPRTFAVDHIVPVSDGGSSWPINLALCTKALNIEKGVLSKRKFLNTLKTRYGNDWYQNHRQYIKEVDTRRKFIDQRRKRCVSIHMERLVENLQTDFPGSDIDYALEGGQPVLRVGLYSVRFPAGFVRQRARFNSLDYLKGIVGSLLFDSS